MRRAVVSGQFYPADPVNLNGMLGEFIHPSPDPYIQSAIVPHAGYVYSGKTAGKVYSLIPEADVYVIVGPNHTGYGSGVSVSSEDWLTPLGVARVDEEFIDALPKKIIDLDELAHRYEHSIEVQIPFLQHLYPEVNIVAVCMGLQDEDTAREVAEEIIEAIEKTGKKAVMIASSDFSHYVPDDMARSVDGYIIDAIRSMDTENFYKRIYEKQASVCGVGPIAVSMHIANHYKCSAELIDYSTSGDVADRSSVVGYAGIVFRRRE